MHKHNVVSQQQWLAARKELLLKEKEFTRQRDALSKKRRELPWVKIDKAYVFNTTDGNKTLADLFNGCSQLIVYHFMYGPDWDEGCPSCSYWADNFNGVDIHLKHRDINLIAISRAPLKTLNAYKERMGWTFNWISSCESDFNHDFHVTFTTDEINNGRAFYNYAPGKFPVEEAPGISVFYKGEHGDVYHTYSCYARGLDMLNGAYHYMDLAPKGRDEDALPNTMAWLHRHDQYED